MVSTVKKGLFLSLVVGLRQTLPVTGFVGRSLRLEPFRLLSERAITVTSAEKKTTNGQDEQFDGDKSQKSRYNLGLGRNQPVLNSTKVLIKQVGKRQNTINSDGGEDTSSGEPNGAGISTTTRKLVATDEGSDKLRAALWDESHYSSKGVSNDDTYAAAANWGPPSPVLTYPDIDLSIPDSVYKDDGSVDHVWKLLRYEAYQESLREPLLVSFLYSTILNHPSLESSLAFLLGNRLQSPAMMISTQLQSLILEALHQSPGFRRALRADIMAVRDRDPACNALPDVFLYFKGFHALQSYRVAHYLWLSKRRVLASYLQSQVSQVFQIDIHPNATIGNGIMLDHGTGIVMGETASIGNNCSILHHVTLGGSGKKGVVRHPQVGNGVLLGAGATLLGPVKVGDGSQVGAGTLVISDLPAHCVAVGVPARIIGNFIDVSEQPSVEMNQVPDSQEMRPIPEFFSSENI
eukprot:scaffold8210_cov175-Amphora_coffeaeformis.AAC.6